MRQSSHELGIAKIEGTSSQELNIPRTNYERRGLRRLAKLAACAGALSLGFTASDTSAEPFRSTAHHGTSPGLEFVGYNTNKIWVTDQAAAEQEAELVAASGANTVRIQEPYTQGGAEAKNDTDRLCNAAIVADRNHLHLIITIVGHYRDGRLGFMPSSESEKRRFVTALGDMLWRLAGDNNGCVPRQKDITLGIINEPDNPDYDNNQIINGEWVAPGNEVGLLSYSYPRLKAEATKPGLNVNLTLIGGELSSPSSSRNNVNFIEKMAQIIKDRKIKGPIMDMFALHQYANSFDTSFLAPNNSFNSSSVDAVRTYLGSGPNIPIIYDELGAFASTPKNKEKQYKVRLPASVKPFSSKAQGDFYQKFINDAACAGVVGVMIFHHDDDPGDVLRTGVAFPDATPKESKKAVDQAFANALNNSLICS